MKVLKRRVEQTGKRKIEKTGTISSSHSTAFLCFLMPLQLSSLVPWWCILGCAIYWLRCWSICGKLTSGFVLSSEWYAAGVVREMGGI